MNYSLQMNEKTYFSDLFPAAHPSKDHLCNRVRTRLQLNRSLPRHRRLLQQLPRGQRVQALPFAAEDALLQVPELVILALLCQQLVMGPRSTIWP